MGKGTKLSDISGYATGNFATPSFSFQRRTTQKGSTAGADACKPGPSAASDTVLSRKLHRMTMSIHRRHKITAWLSSAALTSSLWLPAVIAQEQTQELDRADIKTTETSTPDPAPATELISNSSIQGTYRDAYILGAGDAVLVELLDIPEYSGVFPIGPDGTLYLPRLRSLSVEGLTVEELRNLLTQQFSSFVRDPQVYVSPSTYRPIRVYIGGEVQRPGYYYLSGQEGAIGDAQPNAIGQAGLMNLATGQVNSSNNTQNLSAQEGLKIKGVQINQRLRLPTVFDALRAAGGVTPFSKLNEVSVTRKLPLSRGGRMVQAKLNFLELITDGNETQNIRLFDGDSVVVPRSPVELREQIIKAGQSNLSPDFFRVYVTGRVRDPGSKVLPQGATLDSHCCSWRPKGVARTSGIHRFNRNGSMTNANFLSVGNLPVHEPLTYAWDVVRSPNRLCQQPSQC